MYDVWSVDREGEAQRFAAHDKISNRKLLWHGTNGETYVVLINTYCKDGTYNKYIISRAAR